VSPPPAPSVEPGTSRPSPRDPESLWCDVSRERDTASLRPVGDLDIATVPVLLAEIAQLRQAGCQHLIIDLSDLAFMDSTGLRFLIECYAESCEDGFTMALLPGPPALQRVFELTDTTTRLPFIDP
jgi:stage II sporulation protein AA (anti-sigma F factor antagonist)